MWLHNIIILWSHMRLVLFDAFLTQSLWFFMILTISCDFSWLLIDFSTFRDSCTSFYFMSRTFSEDLKWRVVYLYYNGYSRRKIAKLLYISKSVVDKVLQIYTQWGTIVNPWQKLPERHKMLNRNEMMVICEFVNKKRCILLF